MRRLLALLLFVGGPLLVLLRRRRNGRESVSLHYDDGSMVTLESSFPGVDRLVTLARQAL
jgi:hypothetical protein